MNRKHKKTLEAIFSKPTKSSILWTDIEKLFWALGAEIENKGGSVLTVKFNSRLYTFHRPHPRKEARIYCVNKVRVILIDGGVMP